LNSNGKEDNLKRKLIRQRIKSDDRLTKSALPRIHEMDRKKRNQKWLTVIERNLNRPPERCSKVHCMKKE